MRYFDGAELLSVCSNLVYFCRLRRMVPLLVLTVPKTVCRYLLHILIPSPVAISASEKTLKWQRTRLIDCNVVGESECWEIKMSISA